MFDSFWQRFNDDLFLRRQTILDTRYRKWLKQSKAAFLPGSIFAYADWNFDFLYVLWEQSDQCHRPAMRTVTHRNTSFHLLGLNSCSSAWRTLSVRLPCDTFI